MLTFAWILWWVLTILLGIVALVLLVYLVASVVILIKDRTFSITARFGEILLSTTLSTALEIAFYIFLSILIFKGYLSQVPLFYPRHPPPSPSPSLPTRKEAPRLGGSPRHGKADWSEGYAKSSVAQRYKRAVALKSESDFLKTLHVGTGVPSFVFRRTK